MMASVWMSPWRKSTRFAKSGYGDTYQPLVAIGRTCQPVRFRSSHVSQVLKTIQIAHTSSVNLIATSFPSINALGALPPGMPLWSKRTASEPDDAVNPVDVNASKSDVSVVKDRGLTYTRAQGGNGSAATYQEAVGAPVESRSPLGYHVGWLTVIFLNVNQMIGTGIFSTRKPYRAVDNLLPPSASSMPSCCMYAMLTVTSLSLSRNHPEQHGLHRSSPRLLGHWCDHGLRRPGRVPRTSQLLPQP